jgi:hypothetical protein
MKVRLNVLVSGMGAGSHFFSNIGALDFPFCVLMSCYLFFIFPSFDFILRLHVTFNFHPSPFFL